ncbi:hypothetical protein KGF54_001249 [Candida jiufengensis]|uniref:uncharacterized protein n=1 Tax=Candida jiufengensis TaxID=497108 RepID=UPI002224C172|nr:uncharacterized protein KGF54_001249 [Candida jiufengensis]KAI5955747.1 hypothetical protein KGF54_001249 [Candida jiufengensis]
MIGIFSILNVLISIVYPIIASCKAFEDYTSITNSISSQNFKIKGITVPLNLIYNSSNSINENDEKILQLQLINLQKWFIYWIIQGFLQFFENFLFFITILPGYSLLKLIFNIWLILPMISKFTRINDLNENINFDQTIEWQNFTKTGSGFLFFNFLKPWIEKNIDLIRNIVLNPFDFQNLLKLSSILKLQNLSSGGWFNGSNNKNTSNATTSNSNLNVNDFASYLDSSFVMVMNMKNKFTGNGESQTGFDSKDTTTKINEEFDIIDSDEKNEINGKNTANENVSEVNKRKGYFW